MTHENDICIGPDAWICSGDVLGGRNSAIEVDRALAPICELIAVFETECVAGCCGIGAYAFWPDDIAEHVEAVGSARSREIVKAISDVRFAVAELPDCILVSKRMNHFFHKSVLLELLNHLQSSIIKKS